MNDIHREKHIPNHQPDHGPLSKPPSVPRQACLASPLPWHTPPVTGDRGPWRPGPGPWVLFSDLPDKLR